MKSRKWMGVVVLGALLAVGCGGDDDDDDDSSGGSSGKGSTEPKDAGSPMMMLPEGAVACGKNTCMPVEGEMVTLCCADPFAGTCGMMQGTSGCVNRVENFPGCPAAMGAGGMFRFPSCCIEGMCGINASMFMPGGPECTELGEAAMRAADMGAGSFIMFPAPQACP